MEQNGFEVEIPLRWGDMDAYGHVNNVAILQILEEARVALLGMPPSSGAPVSETPAPLVPLFATLPEGVQALISEHQLKYHSPLNYRGLNARVELEITRMTAASLTLLYRLYDPHTGVLCVSASTVFVFFNPATGTLARLSPAQREVISPYVAN